MTEGGLSYYPAWAAGALRCEPIRCHHQRAARKLRRGFRLLHLLLHLAEPGRTESPRFALPLCLAPSGKPRFSFIRVARRIDTDFMLCNLVHGPHEVLNAFDAKNIRYRRLTRHRPNKIASMDCLKWHIRFEDRGNIIGAARFINF
jgi:hypothetical protein